MTRRAYRSALVVALWASGCAWVSSSREAWRLDPDQDSVLFPDDCDDTDPDVGGPDTWYADADGDGYGDPTSTTAACTQPSGYLSDATDCDDTNPNVHPGATETWYDGVDQDCAGDDDFDQDGDGYETTAADGDDCDDADATINPAAVEVWYDGVDQNCDGNDNDADEDGYPVQTDCDDTDASVYPDPSVDEIPYNGIDDNCDITDGDGDADGDGYWASDYAEIMNEQGIPPLDVPEGAGGDCWDDPSSTPPEMVPINGFASLNAADVHPGADERYYDGVDQDCAGDDDFDQDGDGYDTEFYANRAGQTGNDCIDGSDLDDPNPAGLDPANVNPAAVDAPYDGTDANCADDSDYDADGDGYDSSDYGGEDCDDYDASVNPGATEICGDGVDNDCDGTAAGCVPASGSLKGADVQYTGEASNDYAGYSVSGAGDVNRDGYDDLLIGAYANDDGGSYAGAAYLVLGGTGLASLGLSAADAQYTGEASYDYAGYSVSGAGDVNGDGYDDLLIGAYANDDGGSYAGAAYLVLGTASPASMSLSAADAEYTGEASDDLAGLSVSSAGDVNADGYADLLIGAPYNDDGGTWAGAAYLVLGTASPASMSLSAADAEYTGEASDDYGGWSVSSAGDVDGDGYDDLLIGAPYNDDGGSNAGAVYLVLGSPSLAAISRPAANARYTGEAPGDAAGRSVAGAGDVNGDGYDDLLVGAPYNDDGGSDAGAAYLVLGSPSPTSSMSLSAADAEYTGEASYDNAGFSVSSAGDVNGDGYDDLLVGAPYNDDGGSGAGAAYLLLGSPSPASSMSLSAADAEYTGEASGDYAGFSVSSAADVNADGFDDLLVGAPYKYAGAAYLLYGVGF